MTAEVFILGCAVVAFCCGRYSVRVSKTWWGRALARWTVLMAAVVFVAELVSPNG
jgi:hypothetical protein